MSEVDMMAAELRKPVHFDVKLVSRLKNGIFHAEVCVEMRHRLSGQVSHVIEAPCLVNSGHGASFTGR